MAHIAVERRSLNMEKWAKLIFDKINDCIIKESYSIPNWKVRTAQYFPEGYKWEDDDFEDINEDDMWGGPDVTSVFRCDFLIPEELKGKEVYFRMLTPTEVLVSENGKYLDGLDPNRSYFKYLDKPEAGEKHSIMLEAYTRSKPDDDRNSATRHLRGCLQYFKCPQLIVIDNEMLSLKYSLDIIYKCAYGLYMDEDVKSYMKKHVEEIVKLLPCYDCEAEDLRKASPKVKEYIENKIYNADSPFSKNGKLACVAYSHLDLAYHWQVGQTVQKNARTTLIQLRLMDKHPEFKYAHTQAFIYESLEKYYPQLFEEVKEKVKEGKWEIVGGMYVEPDCNLISAESMIRQIMYGKQYFLEKFNVDVDNSWLPDVFGNSPIMPQILKLGGIDYFVSNKMSTWNDTNVFPHNNFIWRGIDGSEVFACVPPVHFITWMEPDQAIENWNRYQDKDVCDESLQMFGYGDGGSGVTGEMLEYYEIQNKLPGIPKMRITTGKEYLHSSFDNKEGLKVWDGDLYLEMHRGTFTTKAELKKLNRKGEFLAQETETMVAMASILSKENHPTQKEIGIPWKKLLLNQFHDILPGSHTAPVFEDALNTYKEMAAEFNDIRNCALNVLTKESSKENYVVINTMSDRKDGIAYLETVEDVYNSIKDYDGNLYPLQKVTKADGKESYCAITPKIDGLSIEQFSLSKDFSNKSKTHININKNLMENDFFKVDIDDNGSIKRVYDKIRDRVVNAEGEEVNEWQLFDDYPGNYNAWDIITTYKNYRNELPAWDEIEVIENGPITIALRLKRSFGKSKAVQIIRMYSNKKRIDFECFVDWHEDEKLLKVAFPVNVKSRIYTTDTSAGVIERMNNQNTTWEQARFEVPCHKWIDLSEGLFGVSLMNDCKYGCDVEGNVMRLSLLRAPIRPDRESDRGKHYFTYSLFTHDGNWQRGGVVEEAYDLNKPQYLIEGKEAIDKKGWKALEITNPAIKCQALKVAEDGSSDIIFRGIELYGSHGKTTIKTGFPIKKAFYCNINEDNMKEIPINDNEIIISFEPYKIISLRLVKGTK